MVKHIVLFNVREGEDKDAVAALAARHLEPLAGQIPGLISIEVKRCFAGCDFALYSLLESPEALAVYAPHPLHEEAKSHFFHLLSGRMAADYEV
jgi:heme-degrading monooxygenase HmoA